MMYDAWEDVADCSDMESHGAGAFQSMKAGANTLQGAELRLCQYLSEHEKHTSCNV